MATFYQWSPLLIGLAAPLLAWLVAANSTNARRTALFVSLAAVLTLLIELALSFVIVQVLQPPRTNEQLNFLVFALDTLASTLTTLLAAAAWTLLLVAAARTGDRRRLVVLAVVFGLVLALQAGLDPRQAVPPFYGLVVRLETSIRGGYLVSVALHLAAVVAPIAALLMPEASETRAATRAATEAPSALTPPGPHG